MTTYTPRPLVLSDRVKQTTTSSGTGDITLDGSVSGFSTFLTSGATSGKWVYYAISAQSTGGWEVGEGYMSSATNLQRRTVLTSSNGGNLVNFDSGAKDVFITYPAEKGIAAPLQNVYQYINTVYGSTPVVGGYGYSDGESLEYMEGYVQPYDGAEGVFIALGLLGLAYALFSALGASGNSYNMDFPTFSTASLDTVGSALYPYSCNFYVESMSPADLPFSDTIVAINLETNTQQYAFFNPGVEIDQTTGVFTLGNYRHTTNLAGVDPNWSTFGAAPYATEIRSSAINSLSSTYYLQSGRGGIQRLACPSGGVTFVDAMLSGGEILLELWTDTFNTLVWPAGMKWVGALGATAPTNATYGAGGNVVIKIWKYSTTLYGNIIGVVN